MRRHRTVHLARAPGGGSPTKQACRSAGNSARKARRAGTGAGVGGAPCDAAGTMVNVLFAGPGDTLLGSCLNGQVIV